MRKILSILGALLLSTSLWATTVTYTVTSTSDVSVSGTAPAGSSQTYASTYTTKCQLIKDKSMTLTLSGFQGKIITGIKLSMKSNKSAGSGTLSVVAGTTTIASIAEAKFNAASWYGAWSQEYVDVTPAMTKNDYEIQNSENVVITIAATENSLYCQSFEITYKDPTQTLYLAPSMWATGGEKFAIYYGNADWSVNGWSEFMELVEGESSIYQAEIPKGMKYAIYVRLNSAAATPNWDDKYNQTGNLEIPTDGKNCATITAWHEDDDDTKPSTASWSAYTAPVLTDVFFVNIDNWAKVNVYGWLKSDGSQNNGWPGVEMAKTGDQLYGSDIYKGRINETYNMVIISNNGSDEDRTGDQPFDKTKPYFYSGNWYASVASIPANCAYINAAANNTSLTMNKGAVVVYAEGKYAFVKDASGSALIFDNSANHGLETGDTITADIPGKVSIYNGLPEFVATTYPITSVKEGKEPEIPWATEEPKATNLNQVVVYDTVTFASSAYDNKSITGTWKTKSIKFYDQWGKAIVFDTDKKYKVTAANAVYSKSGTTTYQAYIIYSEVLCLGGPFGLQVNNVSDTLEYIADAGLEAEGYKQYGINNKVLAAGDKIVIENLSCNSTWLPAIEDGGAKANFNIVNDTLIAKAAGTFNFYLKNKFENDKLFIAYAPVTNWYIAGDFTKWAAEMKELVPEKADSLVAKFDLSGTVRKEFKLVRVVTTGSVKDSTWFALNDEQTMRYGASTNWFLYAGDGTINETNVGLEAIKAGEYVFSVNPSALNPFTSTEGPAVSVLIPEPSAADTTWYVAGGFTKWKEEMVELEATSKKDSLSVKIELKADTAVDFKLVRVIIQDQLEDTTWYGIKRDDYGNLDEMSYGHSTGFWFFSGLAAENVKLNPTNANDDYTFSVDVAHKDGDDNLAPIVDVIIPKKVKPVDPRAKREIVLDAGGQLQVADPSMFVFGFGNGKAAYDTVMTIKKVGDDTLYVARIPEELDSLIFVRAVHGLEDWSELVWDATDPNYNVWNQTADLFIDCDTAVFKGWVEGTNKFDIVWCPVPVVPSPITYQVKVPEGTENVYIAGDFNTWTPTLMTKNGNVFEFTVTEGDKSAGYKYCSAADFEHVEVAADRSNIANRTYGDTTDVVALFKDPDWTNVFLKGAFTDWNEVEFRKTDVATVLSLSSSINAAIVDFVIVDRSGDYEVLYKIAEGASNYDRTASESVDEADRWWGLTPDGPDTKNVWLDADINGLYNFQWATDTHNIKIVFPTATGCENVYGTEVELRKVIENGVLYIYRDGKVYNIQGQLVR